MSNTNWRITNTDDPYSYKITGLGLKFIVTTNPYTFEVEAVNSSRHRMLDWQAEKIYQIRGEESKIDRLAEFFTEKEIKYRDYLTFMTALRAVIPPEAKTKKSKNKIHTPIVVGSSTTLCT